MEVDNATDTAESANDAADTVDAAQQLDAGGDDGVDDGVLDAAFGTDAPVDDVMTEAEAAAAAAAAVDDVASPGEPTGSVVLEECSRVTDADEEELAEARAAEIAVAVAAAAAAAAAEAEAEAEAEALARAAALVEAEQEKARAEAEAQARAAEAAAMAAAEAEAEALRQAALADSNDRAAEERQVAAAIDAEAAMRTLHVMNLFGGDADGARVSEGDTAGGGGDASGSRRASDVVSVIAALRQLIAALGDCSPAAVVLFAERGGVDDAVAAVRAHTDSRDVVLEACRLLAVVGGVVEARPHMVTSGANAALLDALGRHMADVDVAAAVLLALSAQQTAVTPQGPGADDGSAVVVSTPDASSPECVRLVAAAMAMHAQSRDVMDCACCVLVQHSRDADGVAAVMASGAVDAVFAALERWPDDVRLAENAVALLTNLGSSVPNQLGLITTVLRTMERHAAPSVLSTCCAVLCNISTSDANKVAIVHAGGIDSVLAAMGACPDSDEVQEKACALLWRVMTTPESKAAVVAKGGVPLLVAALVAHGSSALLSQLAAAALAGIASIDEGRAAVVACPDSATAVVAALRAHGAVDGVQQYGCWVLLNAGADASFAARVRDCGGTAAVIDALSRHCAVADAAEMAAAALRTLLVDADAAVVASLADAVAPALVAAMDASAAAADVQLQCCRAVAAVAAVPAARAALLAAGVKEAVQRAKAAHTQRADVDTAAKAAIKALSRRKFGCVTC
jgi:hypothetical protein